jgi:hypothetical protein
VKANRRMLEELSTYMLQEVVCKIRLAGKLQQLLKSSLAEFESAIFLDALLNQAAKDAKLHFDDLTGWECFVNHIHVEDYLGKRKGKEIPLDILLQGLKYATELTKKLQEYRAGETNFLIIVSFADQACSVRFHKFRTNEEWVSENLEQYADEAVCVFETGYASVSTL